METALFSPSSLFGNTSDNSSDEEPNTQQNFVERTHQFPGMELIVREFSFHQLNGNLLWPDTWGDAFSNGNSNWDLIIASDILLCQI
ncbi:uncharacterized protein LOC110719311 isoform X2 [Chenopodium quinoa]|uniref:uncharacterized protein LOC110719311 isoform X2 n=1 Tax=Chenopodium quinoa TaxID=63459 RepID=UPI000B78DB2F|nr:uncharacterized protein LOC110719311 isoform X2 [Chenopodium quinoa]